MDIIINTKDLPTGGEFYEFKELKFGMRFIPLLGSGLFDMVFPEVLPAEPITKPAPKPEPIIRPDENPWIWPFPSVDPTPKGFI